MGQLLIQIGAWMRASPAEPAANSFRVAAANQRQGRPRPRWLQLSSLLTLMALLHAGCASTSYVPRTRGYLAPAQHNGMPVFVRDGRVFDGGVMSGGLIAATEGVPAAQAYAADAQSSFVHFIALYLGGLVALAAGGGIAASGFANQDINRSPGNTTGLVGASLAAVGLVMLSGSIWSATHMQASRLDAINAYNDMRWQQSLSRRSFGAPTVPGAPPSAGVPPAAGAPLAPIAPRMTPAPAAAPAGPGASLPVPAVRSRAAPARAAPPTETVDKRAPPPVPAVPPAPPAP